MKRTEVIILGAGAAGLAAAQILSDAGRSVLILEARDRIGGRICTIRDRHVDMPIELGAEFIHGRPDVTLQMVSKAGLTACEIPFEHHHLRNGRLVKLPDFEAEIGKVMNGLSRLGKDDISFAQYLREHHRGRQFANARQLALDFAQGFDAADPERISAQSVAEEQEGVGDLDAEGQFRLLRGYGSLIEYMRRSLDKKRIAIRLRTSISEIRWKRGHVELLAGRTGREIFRASRVIVTFPLGVLQLPPETAGSVRFSPDIPDQRKAAMQLASGPIVKVIAVFREMFWEDQSVARSAHADESLQNASFLHDTRAAYPTWWTPRPLRLPVLTGWAGGPKALSLTGLKPALQKKAALESLAGLFSLKRNRLESLLQSFHVVDWPADPYARGAYSYVTVGGMRARAQLAKPVKNTLFFAGEATDTTGQASTVAGALLSGQRAAREVLKAL